MNTIEIALRSINDAMNNNQNKRYYWYSIKNNIELLELATTVERDRFDIRDIFRHSKVVEEILLCPSDVNQNIYYNIVEKICSNSDLARFGHGTETDCITFLMLVLKNPDLNLTEEEKEFVISEAKNLEGSEQFYEDQLVLDPILMHHKYYTGRKQTHNCYADDLRYLMMKNPVFKADLPELVHTLFAEYPYTPDEANDPNSYHPYDIMLDTLKADLEEYTPHALNMNDLELKRHTGLKFQEAKFLKDLIKELSGYRTPIWERNITTENARTTTKETD